MSPEALGNFTLRLYAAVEGFVLSSISRRPAAPLFRSPFQEARVAWNRARSTWFAEMVNQDSHKQGTLGAPDQQDRVSCFVCVGENAPVI